VSNVDRIKICESCKTYCENHHVHILCPNCECEIEVASEMYAFYWTHSPIIPGTTSYSSCAVHNHGALGINSIYGDRQAEHPTGLSAAEWVERTH
jgi:hypothetical protein